MHNCCHLHAADAVIGIVKAVASRAHGCDASQSCCGKIRLMYGLSAHLKRYGINRELAVFIIIESKVHRQRLSTSSVEKLSIPAASTEPTHTGAVTAISLSASTTLI